MLATGARGMLGKYLQAAYQRIVITGRGEIDVCDRKQVDAAVRKYQPTHIFHLAAETNVVRCEKEPDHAYMTNVIGTLNVALACQKHDIVMVYVSTASVFSGAGKANPHTEFDIPAPVNVYGKTKLEGENVVRDLLSRYFIVRTSWMMGGGPEGDHRFVGKMVELMKAQDTIHAVADKYGSPTCARQFATNLRELVGLDCYGLYHLVNVGMCNRYEMAVEIAECLKSDVKVVPVSSAHFLPWAPRPRSEAVRNYKLELLGLNRMTHWKVALRDYLRSWDG